MSRRLSAPNVAKLISEWIENDDKDEDNVEFDDSSDVSELDNVDIDEPIKSIKPVFAVICVATLSVEIMQQSVTCV